MLMGVLSSILKENIETEQPQKTSLEEVMDNRLMKRKNDISNMLSLTLTTSNTTEVNNGSVEERKGNLGTFLQFDDT